MSKKPLGINVLAAARARTHYIFNEFEKVCLSFSGGKDSTVMLHITADEARRRGRRFGCLFVDLEGQYKLTIEHILECYETYKDIIDPYWISLPLNLRNAVSQYEPQWVCWDPDRKEDWIRKPPKMAITDESHFPFFRRQMEFEELIADFGKWYSNGKLTASLVGIRTDESLNRYRTIASDRKSCYEDHKWTTWNGGTLYSAYPIYDWRTEDIWTYHGVNPDRPYNRLYDRMHRAGLSIHQQRICQPYGDDQRKGLWLFHLIEPETWSRIVARVNGANQGSLYANEKGNILGQIKVDKPEDHTWQSFAMLLLGSMPSKTAEHYKNKIAVFLKWWMERGYPNGIPDQAESKSEASKETPSWRRVCKSLLRNDYWCKGLSFSQHKSEAYQKYLKVMKNRRRKWGLI
jgi:predicted phosphoadenosine phosphosulfate sulfurtransferase